MTDRRRGLGRGLGALIGDDGTSVAMRDVDATAHIQIREIPLVEISPNPRQPRTVFDDTALAELSQAMAQVGLLQPIVVRPMAPGYELIAGERRLRAAGLLGWPAIPAIIRHTGDDELLREALLENLHRVALTAIDEAAAYQQLLEDFGGTQEELAVRLGRSRPQITNTLRLLRLPPAVQRRVAAGVLSAGHARALLGLRSAGEMEALAERIVAEGLSVRSTEEAVTLQVAQSSSAGDPQRRTPSNIAAATARSDTATEVAENLAAHLDTRVNVRLGSRRGRIVIDVADEADMLRIAGLIVAFGTRQADGQ